MSSEQGRTADGDRQYFDALYRRHYGAVLRFVTRRTDDQAARDVTAETFLAAWRRLDTLRGSNELAWLYKTAHNVLRQEIRSQHRRSLLAQRVHSQPEAADPDHAQRVVERLHVLTLLAGLPSTDREALQLVEWEHLDVATAAQVVGCSPATFRVRLHRARRRLATAAERAGAERGASESERATSFLLPAKART